jgi:(R,R)-butanediol dehydrogenase/meso-butanediol dehydrogenase/diacetyl reductase
MPDLPSSMRAAVYRGNNRISVDSLPTPRPGPGQVLVEVSHCGVCGTDLHLVMEGMGRPNSVGGHEYTGRIAALGERTAGWALGDPVAVDPNPPKCGRCEYCRAGREALCVDRGPAGETVEGVGAFTEYSLADSRQLLRVPDGLALRDAAIMEPLAVALHGISLSHIEPGQRALVLGAGPIGAMTLAALHARGIDDVAVSEPSPVRRALAARLGACSVVAPDELVDPPSIFDVPDDAAHAVFECSGKRSAAEQGLMQLRRGGTLVLVGTGVTRPRFEAMRILLNELNITGAYNYDPEGLAEALSLLQAGAVPVDLLVEPSNVPLEGLLASMRRLFAGEIGGKVLVTPR